MILYNDFIQFFHEKTRNIHFYNIQENTNQNMQFISFIILISQEITYTLRNFPYVQPVLFAINADKKLVVNDFE